MSPLWRRDQIQVFFAPERVDLVRTSRRLKPISAPGITGLCTRDPDQPVWEPPLLQLEHMVKEAEGTEMMVTLSNHFIRYVTLPPQTEITAPDEVYAYATFRMHEIYAERTDEWVLSISAWNPSSGAICAAITRDLLTRLQELAIRYRIKLRGITPYLASAFDQWQQLFDEKRTYFVLIETGRICIALLVNGVWQGIRNQKVLHGVADELLMALDQEAIFSGYKEAVEEVRVFAPEHPDLVLPENCGWRMIPLSADNLSVPAHYPSFVRASGEADSCVA
ncbi:MAG: hypothetical protein Q8K59_07165 [Nitrosomonas sp.]|nr:hypothetical protein [Nitrosomonas sp.]MDP1950856.1 hypothetical protein [Nitrosomonas sp.]